MSVLDKLSICGIRSFSPEEEEQVKFSTPLTLFLGQNGCGKTTIIECVKFALTGDLPAGTDSGRGFVNDPKLSHRHNIKGHVKLRFKDDKGDLVTVGKFVEVSTQAGGKLRFKNLDPTIRYENKRGEIADIGGRCVDINSYCAQKLNVSKPIINNVIFCHQENSSWPLDEAKKLKERFDEIFGSTEYNKCVEKFRKIIKEKLTNIKVLKEQFEQKRMAKRVTEKLKESLNEKEVRLENILTVIEEKRKGVEPLQTRLNEINELVDSLSATHQQLTSLETTYKGILEQQESLKKHLVEEFEGTDEDLDNEILNFSTFQETARNEILEKESKRGVIDSKVEEINQTIQHKQVAFGQLKQEESQHTKRCQELKELIEKAKVKFDVEADNAEPIPDILYKLNTAYKRQNLTYQDFRKSSEEKEKQLQNAIDSIRDKFAATKESHSLKMSLFNETKEKMVAVEIKLDKLSRSNSLESVDKVIKDVEKQIEKKRAEFNEVEESQKLEELDVLILQKDQLQNKLDREYRILQQNYVTEQKLDSEKSLITDKRGEIATLKQKHQQHFETLFGQDIPRDKFEESVFKIQKGADQKVKSILKDISVYEKKVTSLESALKHTTEKLQNHKSELTRDKAKIENICKGRVFSEVLKESYAKKEKLQKDKGAYRSAKTLFEQFIGQFEQETPCCPVCATDFTSKKSVVPNIIGTLKRRIEDLPKKLTETENLLKKEEELYNKLQQLKPLNENIQILEDAKIPLLSEELVRNTESLDETKMELVSMKNDLVEPENLVETCRKVISDAALLDRLAQEIKNSENLVENLQQDLVTVSSNRTLHDTETECSQVKEELANLRREYRTKRDIFEQNKENLQGLVRRLQNKTIIKMEMQKSLQEQPLLKTQVAEYKKTIAKLEEEKKQLAETVSTLQKELADAQTNRNKFVQNNNKRLDENRKDLEASKRLIDEIEKQQNIIQIYENGDSKNKLERILTELENCKSNIAKLEETKQILMNSIVRKREELANQETKFRSLNDNKDLRISRTKSKDLECKIADLRKQIGHHNSKSICEERRKVIDKIDAIQTDINRKKGELDTIKELIRNNKLELNKKEHKEAIIEYKKKFYEVRIEELAVKDLGIYTEALEKSILKFHKERMVQINMTIRDLWRNIYKGNDIDYIEIQTVDDIGGGANKRRSYNYKVVQMKKGIELEMRGRCSAGQKVLACLVIRMALAETFSANCGIFALDEPTTNLDRDNIMSLSDALSRIIDAREKQKSFQLLIITHDEDFLQTLTRDQSVSHYFRVQRNREGFSEIVKEIL